MFARPGTTWTFDSSDNVDLAQAEQHISHNGVSYSNFVTNLETLSQTLSQTLLKTLS